MRMAINPSAKDHPVWRAIVGVAFLIGQLTASAYTIMTDEALFGLHMPFSWAILSQPWNLLHGQYSGMDLWAVMYAFFLVSCYLLLSLMEHFKHNKAILTKIWAIVALDSFGNASYFSGYSIAEMLISTLLLFFFLSYGGKIGMALVASAIRDMRRIDEEED